MTEKKILLIEPPFCRLFKDTYSLDRYPLGLGYLAETILHETEWSVEVYNADFAPKSEWMQIRYITTEGFDNSQRLLKNHSAPIWRKISTVIRESNCSVIGISAKSQNFVSVSIIVGLVKAINPNILVIVGGPHPSMVKAEILKEANIDIAVIGEGEQTIVELLNAIEAERKLDSIKGIVFRKNREIIQTPPREYISDLDSLPFPNQHAAKVLQDFALYPKEEMHVFATRGCPFDCFFCGSKEIWSRLVRFRSPMNVVREIQQLGRIGFERITFEDDTFGVSERYINELCTTLIEHIPSLKWSCELHVNLVNEPTLDIMKRAGCYLIRIGIESGNNGILKEMRKNYTIEKATAAVSLIREFGIEVHTFFMVGFPQETINTLDDTIHAIRKIKSDNIIYSIFTPYPGTEAYAYCKEKGLIGDSFDLSKYSHQSPLNNFCEAIPLNVFRNKTQKIETLVDCRNWWTGIRKQFTLDKLLRIPSYGVSKSMKLLYRLIRGR